MSLYLLAMAPPLQRGHLIALLRHIKGSAFCNLYQNDFVASQDQLMRDAEMSVSEFDRFASGPLTGQFVRDYPLAVQSFHLAPKLLIANDGDTLALEATHHSVLERIFTAFVIDTDIIYEVSEAMSQAGINPLNGRTFLDMYQATIGVLYLNDVTGS